MMWGFGFGWLWMVLFWVALIGAIVWAVDGLSPRGASGSTGDDGGARRILGERFARGEIDADTYRQLRDELSR